MPRLVALPILRSRSVVLLRDFVWFYRTTVCSFFGLIQLHVTTHRTFCVHLFTVTLVCYVRLRCVLRTTRSDWMPFYVYCGFWLRSRFVAGLILYVCLRLRVSSTLFVHPPFRCHYRSIITRSTFSRLFCYPFYLISPAFDLVAVAFYVCYVTLIDYVRLFTLPLRLRSCDLPHHTTGCTATLCGYVFALRTAFATVRSTFTRVVTRCVTFTGFCCRYVILRFGYGLHTFRYAFYYVDWFRSTFVRSVIAAPFIRVTFTFTRTFAFSVYAFVGLLIDFITHGFVAHILDYTRLRYVYVHVCIRYVDLPPLRFDFVALRLPTYCCVVAGLRDYVVTRTLHTARCTYTLHTRLRYVTLYPVTLVPVTHGACSVAFVAALRLRVCGWFTRLRLVADLVTRSFAFTLRWMHVPDVYWFTDSFAIAILPFCYTLPRTQFVRSVVDRLRLRLRFLPRLPLDCCVRLPHVLPDTFTYVLYTTTLLRLRCCVYGLRLLRSFTLLRCCLLLITFVAHCSYLIHAFHRVLRSPRIVRYGYVYTFTFERLHCITIWYYDYVPVYSSPLTRLLPTRLLFVCVASCHTRLPLLRYVLALYLRDVTVGCLAFSPRYVLRALGYYVRWLRCLFTPHTLFVALHPRCTHVTVVYVTFVAIWLPATFRVAFVDWFTFTLLYTLPLRCYTRYHVYVCCVTLPLRCCLRLRCRYRLRVLLFVVDCTVVTLRYVVGHVAVYGGVTFALWFAVYVAFTHYIVYTHFVDYVERFTLRVVLRVCVSSSWLFTLLPLFPRFGCVDYVTLVAIWLLRPLVAVTHFVTIYTAFPVTLLFTLLLVTLHGAFYRCYRFCCSAFPDWLFVHTFTLLRWFTFVVCCSLIPLVFDAFISLLRLQLFRYPFTLFALRTLRYARFVDYVYVCWLLILRCVAPFTRLRLFPLPLFLLIPRWFGYVRVTVVARVDCVVTTLHVYVLPFTVRWFVTVAFTHTARLRLPIYV